MTTRSALGLSALLIAAGVTHFRKPEVFEPMVPRSLGGERHNWVVVSGVAEVAVGAAIAFPPTRRLGGKLAAWLFVAVFPANVTMATNAWRDRAARPGYAIGSIVRLPLQIPLVNWALGVARED